MQLNFIKQLLRIHPPPEKKRRLPAPLSRTATLQPSALPSEEELLQTAKNLLLTAHAPALAAQLRIRWNPRMKSTAGMACPSKSTITLNPRLVDFPGEIDRTLRHELAHLLASSRARHRIQPHGREWRSACSDLGIAGESRTHSLPLPRKERQKRYFYHCPHCSQRIARVLPLKSASACAHCCRIHNRGRYDARFRFIKTPYPSP